MSRIITPAVPYRGPIYEGLHVGKSIKIKGQVPYEADRFTVNLQAGTDSNCDRPLHLSIRFEYNTVVRNTYLNRSWGEEERDGSFPFAMGSSFTLVIEVDTFAYKISVNGTHCWDYRHRIPFSRACSLVIDGDVILKQIEYKNKCLYPPTPATSTPVSLSKGIPGPIYYPPTPVASAPVTLSRGISGPIPTLPCIFPIYGGIRPGMSIYINGRPTGNPEKFSVNIQSGTSAYNIYPPPDIAFHFDVRFVNHSIVRNSRVNGMWSSEETIISHFPFVPGANFDMIIEVHGDSYVIMLNGQHFLSFRHRLNDFPRFNILSIERDVVVTSIRYT